MRVFRGATYYNKGMIALAHNGNLVNAHLIRHRLEQQGSIFQTTSDTEVVVHLIAQSKEQTLPEAIADALRIEDVQLPATPARIHAIIANRQQETRRSA